MDKREVLDELTLEEKAHLLVGERFLELGRLPKKGDRRISDDGWFGRTQF